MALIETLALQTSEELQSYVFDLLKGRIPTDGDPDLLPALALYEGPVGLLRRLYEKLEAPQRATIALALLRHLEDQFDNFDPTNPSFDPVTDAAMSLADPYLVNSSVSTTAVLLLEEYASIINDRSASAKAAVQVNLALLNLGQSFDPDHWKSVAQKFGQETYGIVLSGLVAIGIGEAFNWLGTLPSSQHLTELLKAHIPNLHRRAPEIVEAELTKLLAPETSWTGDAKADIRSYCDAKKINVGGTSSRALVPISRAMQSIIPFGGTATSLYSEVPSVLNGISSDKQITLWTRFYGAGAGLIEHQTGNGRDNSAYILNKVMATLNGKRIDLMPGVQFLRAKSVTWRNVLYEDFDRAQSIIVKHIADDLDAENVLNKFVGRWHDEWHTLIAKQHEYHEDRIVMNLFRELVQYKYGPRVQLESGAWGEEYDPGRKGILPVIRIMAKVLPANEAEVDPTTIYEFKGYHVFARTKWLREQIGKEAINGLDLERRVRLAISGGVLLSGAQRFGLNQYFTAMEKEKDSVVVERTRRRLKAQSEQLLEAFLRGTIHIFLAGAIHAEMLKQWLLDYDISVLMEPKHIEEMINWQKPARKVRPRRNGIFDQLKCAFPDIESNQQHHLEKECVDVFRLIADFVYDMYVEEFDTAASQRPGSLEWAWRIFVFGLLGAEIQPWERTSSNKRYLSFASDPTDALQLFQYNNFGVVRGN